MILIQIFNAFLRIGLFTIGGAYSFLPLIQREVVERYHWLTKEEFLDVLGMVQIFPGAISIKFATYTGYKTAGIPGMVVANVANLLPPVLLILGASTLYFRYHKIPSVQSAFQAIQLVVFAMIIAVAFQTIEVSSFFHLKNLILIVGAFSLFLFTKIHPAFIIIGAGALGALIR